MFDGKVLTAVFATLAAVAAAMNGGSLAPDQLESSTISAPGDATFDQVVPESMSFGGLLRNPEPKNPLSASFQAERLDGTELTVKSAVLEVDGLRRFRMGSRKFSTRAKVSFKGFSGSIVPGTKSEVRGGVNGFRSGPVNMTGSFRIDREVETDLIRLRNVRRSGLKLENVEGSVESNSTSAEVKDPSTDLSINSFSGSIKIFPGNDTVVLEGKVDRLEAGSLIIGSD